jgi:hypothetical protein
LLSGRKGNVIILASLCGAVTEAVPEVFSLKKSLFIKNTIHGVPKLKMKKFVQKIKPFI